MILDQFSRSKRQEPESEENLTFIFLVSHVTCQRTKQCVSLQQPCTLHALFSDEIKPRKTEESEYEGKRCGCREEQTDERKIRTISLANYSQRGEKQSQFNSHEITEIKKMT